jgi:hypothetical protein
MVGICFFIDEKWDYDARTKNAASRPSLPESVTTYLACRRRGTVDVVFKR